MATTESSALIRFIAQQQGPIQKSARAASPPPAVLAPLPKKGRWKLWLGGIASLIVAGMVLGLWVSQSSAGRWFVSAVGWAPPEEAAADPAEEPDKPAPSPSPVTAAGVAPAAATSAAAPAMPPTPAPKPVAAAAVVPPEEPEAKKSTREGTLIVSSKPTCDIVIDGKKTGMTTPQRGIKLKPGKHKIALVNDRYDIEKKFTVKIKKGKTTKLSKDLRRYMD